MTNWQASDDVIAYLASYRPEQLPRAAWVAAREQVVAAVVSSRPRTVVSAKQLTTALVAFLADPAIWDQRTDLDLPALLVADRVGGFIARRRAAGARESTLSQRASALARLVRGVHGLPIDERCAPGTATASGSGTAAPASQAQALRALLAAGHPLPVAGAAWAQWCGRGVVQPLRRIVSGLAPAVPDALQSTGGAAVGHVLLQLPEVSTSGARVPATPSRPTPASPPPAPASGKPMSRAAALRHARAQQAVLDRLEAAGHVQLDFDSSSLSSDVVDAVDAYSPQGMPEATWCELEALHRRLVLGYRPSSRQRASNVATAVCTFLRYVHALPGREPGTVTAEQVLVAGLLDTWIATLPDGTATSYRSLIRRCLDSLTPGATRSRISYTPRPAPYTPDECRTFARLVHDQPSIGRRRAGCLIVGLGLGAGLDARDWRALRRHDVREDKLADGTPVLVVDIPESSRPARTVVIRAAYEELVRRGLEAHDEAGRAPDALLVGEDEDRRSVLDGRIRALTTARGGAVDIDAGRLRNTWIVAALSSSLPLPVVMAAAGLTSARTISDLLPYCAEPDPDAVAAALASLPDSPLPVRAPVKGRS